MHYILLIYDDLSQASPLTDAEWEGGVGALRAAGTLLVAQRLGDRRAAATVRAPGGDLHVEPGALPASGPGLRALMVIRARDLNDAIRSAAALPEARQGPIEVWPLQDR